jgi:hypothetical protein
VKSNEHYLPLMLNAKLKMALIKLQADKELGQSYAGLLALVEGLHSLKYLNDEDYLIYQKRYSQKLVDDPQQKLMAQENHQAIQEQKNMTALFSNVLADWSLTHKRGWREDWVKRASPWANRIKAAQMIVDLGTKESVV